LDLKGKVLAMNVQKLKEALEIIAKPFWRQPSDVWNLRPGGGERYIQEQVLPNAQPHLQEEALRTAPKEKLLSALKANYNLLAVFESVFTKNFINFVSENDLMDHIIDLLYGPGDIALRLRHFLSWANVEPIPGENKKRGINATVASYLLAVSNPRQYAYCKPTAYNSAVKYLLGIRERRTDPVERFLHCTKFYQDVLNILEHEYGLSDGNLFDVHSLFWCFQSKGGQEFSPWEKVTGSGPSPEPTGAPPDHDLYQILISSYNLVLYGPPGTGKTREALLLADQWRRGYGSDSVVQLTFHPSYSYEDFIEGFRPDPEKGGFTRQDGVFRKICSDAADNPDKKYLVVIDEINRGDMARILGELITLVEGDKRGERYSTTLPQSGDKFFVPENLYLLGTMNTADKSISLMDLAIRRRFRFVPLQPDPEVIKDEKRFRPDVKGVDLATLLISLNKRLLDVGVDRDRLIGHSYLLIEKTDEQPVEALRQKFKYDIIPLIEEYCYADRSLMARVLGELVDDFGAVNAEVIDEDTPFIHALKSLTAEFE
jgi:5-methylcytosine-specific restriction protein B